MNGSGAAPAKVILLGEQFVVYGVPALALPVPDLSVRVHLSVDSGRTPDVQTPGNPAQEHLRTCLRVCHEQLGGPEPGRVRVRVKANVPASAGLGSSAALAVATARAWCVLAGVLLQDEPDPAGVRRAADACERVAHGNPSGIDVATVQGARALRFVRGEGSTPLAVGPGLGLLILNTGTPGRTRETVARVAAAREADPQGWAQRTERARALVALGEDALGRGDAQALGAAMNPIHDLLAELGVSTPALDQAVQAARAAGATGAKLTGGGGGGCALAICPASERAAITQRLTDTGTPPLASLDLRTRSGAKEPK